MDTPFQCGGSVKTLSLNPGQRLVLRVEAGTFLVYGCINKTVTSTKGDFYLQGGEAMEIMGTSAVRFVTLVNVTNDPKVFWYVV